MPALASADKPPQAPTLEARALLAADATWPANSRSFLLRVYRVRPRFERNATGSVEILDAITLRDPDHKIPFAIVRETTPERLLTGGDLDIESVRVDRRGTLWFGDEFGPFLLNTDATGKVLRAPIPLPGVKSPDYPDDYQAPVADPNLGRSNGFEGMALTADGRTLVQGALGWLWARSERAIPIPGFKSVAQAEENAGALAHGALPADRMRDIDALLQRAVAPAA
jgi:hypothetical protein